MHIVNKRKNLNLLYGKERSVRRYVQVSQVVKFSIFVFLCDLSLSNYKFEPVREEIWISRKKWFVVDSVDYIMSPMSHNLYILFFVRIFLITWKI